MSYLALDLSKTSTGWAHWDGVRDRPDFASWRLGSEYTTEGGVFAKLHEEMAALHSLMPFETLFLEPPINPAQLQGHTTINTIRLAIGLASHAHSFAHAYRSHVRAVHEINVESWRPDFIGKIHSDAARAVARRAKKAGDSRASARDTLKALTIERCRQLGLSPRTNDEADAIGILTYGILSRGVTPPWIADEVLRQPLQVSA